MKFFFTLISLTLLAVSLVHAGRNLTTSSQDSVRIAFGSCLKPKKGPAPIMYKVADTNPDVFVWLGDVAYTDTTYIPFPSSPFNYFPGAETYRERLEQTKNLTSYQTLKNKTQVVGVWDDHDYGKNDGDISFKYKEITQPIWLDFIDEPQDSPRRQQKGIWDSYYIGANNKIKLILLDTRYYKEGRFFGSDILGAEQWKWLENELKNNVAELTFIGSGYQFFPDDRVFPERWFYESKERLYDLINAANLSGVVLMSGDVHTGEIMRNPCAKERVGYNLYEITASGFTHTINKVMQFFYESWIPPTYYTTTHNIYQGLNFGLIDIKFANGHVASVHLQIKNIDGQTVRDLAIPYEAISKSAVPLKNNYESCSIYAETPFKRILGYHLSHFSNTESLAGRRGLYMYLMFLSCIVIGIALVIKVPRLILRKLFGKKDISQAKNKLG